MTADMQDKASVTEAPKHKDWIEHLCPTIYVRFTCGPDYERAFLCVEDGEPDMRDVATMSFGQARLLMAAYAAALSVEKAPAVENPPPVQHVRPQVEDETEILQRLADGDTIVFSQDGDEAWFTKGDRAFVGNAIMSLREKGFLLRRCDDEENYRGLSEYDTISEAGRAALATTEGSDNG